MLKRLPMDDGSLPTRVPLKHKYFEWISSPILSRRVWISMLSRSNTVSNLTCLCKDLKTFSSKHWEKQMRDWIHELCKHSEIVFLPWWMVSRWTLTVDVESMISYHSNFFVSVASEMARSWSKSCMWLDITLSSKLLSVTWIMFLCIRSCKWSSATSSLFLLLFFV